MYMTEQLQKKWGAIIEHSDLPEIKDAHKRAVTAVLLENQEKALREERQALFEDIPANNISGSGIDKYDPILIGLVRRAMPNLIAYDICGVQPMTAPTGLIFAMKSRYNSVNSSGARTGSEAQTLLVLHKLPLTLKQIQQLRSRYHYCVKAALM